MQHNKQSTHSVILAQHLSESMLESTLQSSHTKHVIHSFGTAPSHCFTVQHNKLHTSAARTKDAF